MHAHVAFELQDQLKHVKENLRKITPHENTVDYFDKCPYENCLPSHFFTTNTSLPANRKLPEFVK